MNIGQEPGRSSKPGEGNRRLRTHGLLAYCYSEADCLRTDVVTGLWRAYQNGGDGGYDEMEFIRRVQRGWIVNFAMGRTAGPPLMYFGIEFVTDEDGPLTNIVYMATPGPGRGVLKRCTPALIGMLYHMAKAWALEHDVPARLMLRGRPGWRRYLKSLSIEMDAYGVITEDQERFRHGLQ